MTVRFIEFDAGTSVNPFIRVPGTPCAVNAGWVQFAYGANTGQLQPINWAKAILIPEYQGATGGYIWCPPTVSYTIRSYTEPTNGFTPTSDFGALNLAEGVLDGINLFPEPVIREVIGKARAALQQVTLNPPLGLTQTDPKSCDSLGALASEKTNWSMYATLLAFACDIAQQTSMYNAAETYESFTYGSDINPFTPSDGVPRSAQIRVGTHPTRSDCKFGSVGVPMLGHYAWDYNGYKGKLYPLNTLKQWTVPEMPTATGLYVMPKPGVNLTVEMGVNAYQQSALTDTLGDINLLANKVAGLNLPSLSPIGP